MTWKGMRARCTNSQNHAYKYYGGRGIRICAAWTDFEVYLDWCLANGWEPGREVDRVSSDGDYTPENCRVVEPIVNRRNRRDSPLLTAFGETKRMAEWAADARCVVNRGTFGARIRAGWAVQDAITTPVHKRTDGSSLF